MTLSVTQSGTVAGTPMYMSPEQAEGFAVDHRSDLFSLGTVLYAMCTGHPPFRASGTHAVLKRVIDASPRPIREINNEIPDWLCGIIAKLHAKKPEDRFQTAKEVAELLGQRLADVQVGRAVQSEPTQVRAELPPPAKKQDRLPFKTKITTAIMGFVSLGMVGAAFALPPRPAALLLAMAGVAIGIVTLTILVMTLAATGRWGKLTGVLLFAVMVGVPGGLLLATRNPYALPLLLALLVVALLAAYLQLRLLGVRLQAAASVLLCVSIFYAGFTLTELTGLSRVFYAPSYPVALSSDDPGTRVRIWSMTQDDPPKNLEGDLKMLGTPAYVLENLATAELDLPVGNYLLVADLDGQEGDRQFISVRHNYFTTTHQLPNADWRAGSFIGTSLGNRINGSAHRFVTITAAANLLKLKEQKQQATAGSDKAGWVQLFNGKDLSGWVPHAKTWTVKDNQLTCTGLRSGLRTTKSLEDYDLELEFQFVNPFPDNGENQRAEVCIHDEPWAPAEPRGGSSHRGSVFSIDRHGISELTGVNQVGPMVAKQGKEIPIGDWNKVEIRCRDGTIQVILNGKDVGTLLNRDPKKGHITLYSSGNGVVNFRNIKIRGTGPTTTTTEPGWVPLFNGKDLTGWKTHPDYPGGWQVADGFLTGRYGFNLLDDTGVLYTERGDYENFHLRVEAEHDRGPSGLLFRSHFGPSRPDKWVPGYLAVIGDHKGIYPELASGTFEIHTGTLERLFPSLKGDAGKWPPQFGPKTATTLKDKWFNMEIIARGDHIVIKVDGKTVVDMHDEKHFFKRGHFALSHPTFPGPTIRFKKIEIKELPSPAPVESGWVQLFNGKDLSGWRFDDAKWTVKDSVIVAKGKGTIQTQRDFSAPFLLRMKLKVKSGMAIIRPSRQGASDLELSFSGTPQVAAQLKNRNGPVANWEHPVPVGAADRWFTIELTVDQNRTAKAVFPENGKDAVALLGRPWLAPGPIVLAALADADEWHIAEIQIKELPPSEPAWVQLFNGKDLDGWKRVAGSWGKVGELDAWQFEKGMLVASGKSRLETSRTFSTPLVLRMEAKLERDHASVGVWPNWMVVLSAIDGKTLIANLQTTKKPGMEWKQTAVKPDEWFVLELVANDKKAQLSINGKVVAEPEQSDLVAGRGAINLEMLTRPTRMHIRKIEIKELPPDGP